METASFSHVEAVLSVNDDFDCDELICRLVGLLSPPDRIAFRRAAEEALSPARRAGARAPRTRPSSAYSERFIGRLPSTARVKERGRGGNRL